MPQDSKEVRDQIAQLHADISELEQLSGTEMSLGDRVRNNYRLAIEMGKSCMFIISCVGAAIDDQLNPNPGNRFRPQ